MGNFAFVNSRCMFAEYCFNFFLLLLGISGFANLLSIALPVSFILYGNIFIFIYFYFSLEANDNFNREWCFDFVLGVWRIHPLLR